MDTKRDWMPLKKRTADSDSHRRPRTSRDDALFSQALEGFRSAEPPVPDWDETKRMILTGHQREHKMIQNRRAATTVWTRKPALITAFSFIILLAFFAVPFSQTNEIGARLIFELAEPGGELQAVDFASILDDPSYGIDRWNTSIRLNDEEDPLVLDLLLLTQDPGAPGAVLSALTAQYPVLAAAETTITPVTENSSGTMFDRISGELQVRIACEGMVAAEIEEMIRKTLAEQGAEGVEVKVTESADGEQRKIMVRVTEDQETDQ